MSIIQIDATIITGILILLTISNLTHKEKEFWLPKADFVECKTEN